MTDARASTLAVPAPAPSHTGYAFGLALDVSFAVPGLGTIDDNVIGAGRRASVDLTNREALETDWPAEDATRLGTIRHDDGRLAMTVDEHAEAGFRLYAPQFGLYRIARDGSTVRCAPPATDVPDWNWQRLLLHRVLPLAAALRGSEVFHASAVAVDSRAIAIVGPGGSGKTSLAVQLLLRGALFVTDDVLALEPRGDHVVAHPGPGVLSIRPDHVKTLAAEERSRLGEPIGRAGKTYLAVPRVPGPVRLSALYLPDRFSGASELAFEPIDPPDPRLIIGSTFMAVGGTRERMLNQLEVCAAVAAGTHVTMVAVPETMRPDELAAAIEEHERSLGPRG